jgi:uncharacterized protein involved in type VI secretion and phage assembly
LLEFEGEPGFLERYSVASFNAFQALGQPGELTLNLHPREVLGETQFEIHVGLQEMLGEKLECSIDKWSFAGIVEKVETNPDNDWFCLTVRDVLSKLDQEYSSRVFSEQTIDDIVSALMPEGQSHECLGDSGSAQVRLAIQYQESSLSFLKRLLATVGGQIWCAAGTVYVGSSPTTEKPFTLRLGRDITDYTVATQLGPESVGVDAIPYADDNTIEQSSHSLAGAQYGSVQDDAISRRESSQTQSTIHVTHEDSSFDDAGQAAQRFLRSQASGRFTLSGQTTKPVSLGAKLSIETVNGKEQTVVTQVGVQGHRAETTHAWSIQAENPESLLSSGEPSPDRMIKSSAIVNDVEDPLNTNRVKVYFPWDPNESSTPWLRVSTPYWGTNHMHYLPPKLGDTVLVAWGQRDMDPLVIGSVMAGQELDMTGETFLLKTAEDQLIQVREEYVRLFNGARGGGTELLVEPDRIVVNAANGQTVTIGSDGILLDDGAGCSVEMTSSKVSILASTVEISNTAGAKISLSGPTVSVNNGALEVT